MRVFRFATALALLASCAPPTLLTAQTSRDTATVKKVHPDLDSTIAHLRQFCRTSKRVAYVCVDTTRQTRSTARLDSLLVASTVVVAPTPAPAPIDTTLTVVASSDFESGSFAPVFSNPWATGIDVIADPTPRASGKVARVHYVTNATTQFDDNKALFPTTTIALPLAGELWFQADVFLPATVGIAATLPDMILRKLFRFGWDGVSFPHPLEMELVAFGPQFAVQNIPSQSFDLGGLTYIDTAVAKLTAGAWHHIKAQIKLNSSFGATDGIGRIWIDNTLIFDHAMRWSDPSWTDDPATYKWLSWGVGYQVNRSVGAIDEYRYWDNLSFSVRKP